MRRFSWLGLVVMVAVVAACSSGDVVSPADTASNVDGSSQDNGSTDTASTDTATFDATVEDTISDGGSLIDAGIDDASVSDTDVKEGPKGHYEFKQELTGLSNEMVLKGVWAGKSGEVVAVGNDGVVARLKDGKWSTLDHGQDVDLLNDVSGVSSDDLWAVGRDGILLHISEDEAQLHPASNAYPTFWGVEMLAPNNAYAVGLGGTVAKFDGMDWKQTAQPTQNSTYWTGLAGSGQTLIAVGQFGAIGHVLGNIVQPIASPTNMNLNDIHTADGVTFYAVGNFGTVLKGGVDGMVLESVPTSANLYGVWVHASDSVYVVVKNCISY